MKIRPEHVLMKLSELSFDVTAIQQEMGMFQMAVEDAMQDANSFLFGRYIWYKTMYQSKHLEVARMSMADKSIVDFEALGTLAEHAEIVKQQSIKDDCLDAFNEGILQGEVAYKELTAQKEAKQSGTGPKIITGE